MSKIPFSTYIQPGRKRQLDKFLAFMEEPLEERFLYTEDWPRTMVDIIDEALGEFFATHLTTLRGGPRQRKFTAKQREEQIEHHG